MKVINFAEQPSLMSKYLLEMRATEIQHDPMRFRRNLERCDQGAEKPDTQ